MPFCGGSDGGGDGGVAWYCVRVDVATGISNHSLPLLAPTAQNHLGWRRGRVSAVVKQPATYTQDTNHRMNTYACFNIVEEADHHVFFWWAIGTTTKTLCGEQLSTNGMCVVSYSSAVLSWVEAECVYITYLPNAGLM